MIRGALPTKRGNDDVGIKNYFRDHATASATSSSVIFFSSNCRATRSARPRNRSSRVPAEIFLMTMASGPLVTMRRSSSRRSSAATTSGGRLMPPALSILTICFIASLLTVLNDAYQIIDYFARFPFAQDLPRRHPRADGPASQTTAEDRCRGDRQIAELRAI